MELEHDTRPEKSPYAREPCAVYFQGCHPLFVYRDLLDQSPKLEARSATAGELWTLLLPDIPADAGHVLIHFLTTGTYQCLRPQGDTAQSGCASEFVTALRAHAAATTLELPALAGLAKEQIERLGKKLPLPSVIDILEGPGLDLGELPEIATYLESRIQSICEDSGDVAVTDSLPELEAPNTVSKFLLRTVLRMKHAQMKPAQMEEPAAEKPLSPEEELALKEEAEMATLLAKGVVKKRKGKLKRHDRARLEFLHENAVRRAVERDAETAERAIQEAEVAEEKEITLWLAIKEKTGSLKKNNEARLAQLQAKAEARATRKAEMEAALELDERDEGETPPRAQSFVFPTLDSDITTRF